MGKLSKKDFVNLLCIIVLRNQKNLPGFESSSIQHALGTDANIQSARNLNRNLSLSFSDSKGVACMGLIYVSGAIMGLAFVGIMYGDMGCQVSKEKDAKLDSGLAKINILTGWPICI